MGTARYFPLGAVNTHFSESWGPRPLAYLAIGVATFCALAVFFLLCERDDSFLAEASLQQAQVSLHRPVSPSVTTSPVHTAFQAPTAKPGSSYAKAQTPRERVPFTVTQSKHFVRVGLVSLGLWKTDLRHNSYNLSVIVNGRRLNWKHVNLDQPVSIPVDARTRPLELVVNGMRKNQISGYITAPAEISR